MEETTPSAAPPKARSGRKALWAVIAIIVAIAVVASTMVLVVLPSLQPSYAKFNLVALDFSYDRIDFNPEHRAKVNQPVWVVFSNEGDSPHEFLLFANKDTALVAANEDLQLALSHHPTATSNDTEKQAALDEYNGLHDADSRLTRYNNIDRDVDPGNTTDLLFVIHEAGTYFYVCHQVDTTATPWMIHQGHGMWGTLIVS